jgi:hypothetical protein
MIEEERNEDEHFQLYGSEPERRAAWTIVALPVSVASNGAGDGAVVHGWCWRCGA